MLFVVVCKKWGKNVSKSQKRRFVLQRDHGTARPYSAIVDLDMRNSGSKILFQCLISHLNFDSYIENLVGKEWIGLEDYLSGYQVGFQTVKVALQRTFFITLSFDSPNIISNTCFLSFLRLYLAVCWSISLSPAFFVLSPWGVISNQETFLQCHVLHEDKKFVRSRQCAVRVCTTVFGRFWCIKGDYVNNRVCVEIQTVLFLIFEILNGSQFLTRVSFNFLKER